LPRLSKKEELDKIFKLKFRVKIDKNENLKLVFKNCQKRRIG
jgi:hypothetical protein